MAVEALQRRPVPTTEQKVGLVRRGLARTQDLKDQVLGVFGYGNRPEQGTTHKTFVRRRLAAVGGVVVGVAAGTILGLEAVNSMDPGSATPSGPIITGDGVQTFGTK